MRFPPEVTLYFWVIKVLCTTVGETDGLRREIHGGLQVVENWNSANSVLQYGKDGA
ncbi:hypothetical protein ABZV61_35555 [Streptomyces sp900116325]|uniref:Tn3 transposase DDE domain-containing protein n=1 Tax=Streptomyces sp. 900116325 TaxID=3154295 RepID=A0ABV2UJF0_9ACTN